MSWKRGLSKVGRIPAAWEQGSCSTAFRGIEIEAHEPRKSRDYVGDFDLDCARCKRKTPHIVKDGEHIELRRCTVCERESYLELDAPSEGVWSMEDSPRRKAAMARRKAMPKDEHPMDVRTREIVREELERIDGTSAGGVTEQDVREMLAEMFEKASEALRGNRGGSKKKPRATKAAAAEPSDGLCSRGCGNPPHRGGCRKAELAPAEA